MFSSLSTLSSNVSTSSTSKSSITTKTLSKSQSQSFEEKIPLTSKEEVEKSLASILTQVQQNQVKYLNLTLALWGRFYEFVNNLKGRKVYSLAVLRNGVLASGSGDGAIKLWDLSSRSCLSTLQGHTDWVRGLTVLPNAQFASCSDDETIKLWDLTLNSRLSVLQGHHNSVLALAVLPNGQLASGSQDCTIKLWHLASNSCLSVLQGHHNSVLALAVLPNGQLASGSYDTTIKLWDLVSRSCLSTLWEHTGAVWALVVLPNGLLASGSLDRTIKLWDLVSNSCLFTLRGHTDAVFALAVLPNDQLASGSGDTTIKLWDLTSNSCVSTLRGHTDAVFALAVFPNGPLASGSSDNTIKLWESKTLSVQYLKPILKALRKNISITYLDLSGNQDIMDDIIDPLVEVFKKPGFLSFFSPKPNTTLRTIDLRRTGVSKKAVKKLERAIQYQRLSIEVLFDCPLEWMMIYFLIIFCRANRNSPFADPGLELCKYDGIGSFLGVPSSFSAQPQKNPSSANLSTRAALSQ